MPHRTRQLSSFKSPLAYRLRLAGFRYSKFSIHCFGTTSNRLKLNTGRKFWAANGNKVPNVYVQSEEWQNYMQSRRRRLRATSEYFRFLLTCQVVYLAQRQMDDPTPPAREQVGRRGLLHAGGSRWTGATPSAAYARDAPCSGARERLPSSGQGSSSLLELVFERCAHTSPLMLSSSVSRTLRSRRRSFR
jgi:hypothetical protein